MKPAPFTYHRASSVRHAAQLLAELGDDAKVIAGGQSLLAMMNFRLARPGALVDLGDLRELSYIRRDVEGLRIGAMTTHHQVERAGQELDQHPVVRDAMRWIGHLPIRTRGTVGGSLAHADGTAEWCLLAVLLDAVIVVHGPRKRREIAAKDFFLGLYTTALDPDEIVVEVVFPRPAFHASLVEYAERAGDFAVIASAVWFQVVDDQVMDGALVLGGVQPIPTAVTLPRLNHSVDDAAAIAELVGEAAEQAVMEASDLDGDPEESRYRAALAASLSRTAVAEALIGREVGGR